MTLRIPIKPSGKLILIPVSSFLCSAGSTINFLGAKNSKQSPASLVFFVFLPSLTIVITAYF